MPPPPPLHLSVVTVLALCKTENAHSDVNFSGGHIVGLFYSYSRSLLLIVSRSPLLT
jgi:hypothetical protein